MKVGKNTFFALGGDPFFYDLGLKKYGLCPESLVGPLSKSDNTLCEWGKICEWPKVVGIPGGFAL